MKSNIVFITGHKINLQFYKDSCLLIKSSTYTLSLKTRITRKVPILDTEFELKTVLYNEWLLKT